MSATPSQLHTRARVLLVAAILAILATFAATLFGGQRATVMVLTLLVLAAVLFIASVVVRRAGDAKRHRAKRD